MQTVGEVIKKILKEYKESDPVLKFQITVLNDNCTCVTQNAEWPKKQVAEKELIASESDSTK